MNLSEEIRSFCSQHSLKLNKDLGQHFLTDQSVLDSIINAADIQTNDYIVEIGPGIGILTRELTARAGKVTAIEVDKRFPDLIKEYTGNRDNLNIIMGNALHTPMPKEPYKIVANIPYHITSPLLRHVFLESNVQAGCNFRRDAIIRRAHDDICVSTNEKPVWPKSLTLLIQREVAEKICDQKNKGLLTILVGLFGEPEIIARVPPGSFLPPPKVDSSILHIKCFNQPIANRQTIDHIFKLTKIAFGQKRKMLRKSIGSLEGGMELLKKAEIDPARRPQTLSIEEWIRLAV